ncbi:MAG: hypothetical protein ACXU9U_05840, partial [Parachlamydiaceae bacterium]
MYLYFLESLAKNNKLHFLKPYAQQEQTHQSHLRQNLVDLDYSFMKTRALPLEWFFGNATFNALNYKSLPTEMLIKRLLLKLFSRCGDNPVGDPTSFENNLISLLDDFNQGYIFLPEQILSKLGDLVKIGKGKNENPLVPVDGWLQSIQDLYDSLKEYILKCLPLKWE